MRCVSVDAPKLRCRFARGPDDLVVALLLHDLAGLYESIGRYSDAYRRSLAINEREHGPHRGEKLSTSERESLVAWESMRMLYCSCNARWQSRRRWAPNSSDKIDLTVFQSVNPANYCQLFVLDCRAQDRCG